MKLFKNNTLPALFIAVLLVFSSSGNVYGQFYRYIYAINPPAPEEEGTFLVMNDGSKVQGKKIEIGSLGGLHMDKEKYPHDDVKAFQAYGYYFVRYGLFYIKRIVHGRVNIYIYVTDIRYGGGDNYFIQMGDDGHIAPLNNLEAFASLLQDCPKVYEKLNLTEKELRKIVRKDHNYVNQALEEYNTKCK